MQDFRNFFEIFSIFCGFSPLCAVLRPVLPCYGFLSLYIRYGARFFTHTHIIRTHIVRAYINYGAREKNCVKKLKFAENYDIILFVQHFKEDKTMKKKLTIVSLGFIGAAILWFACLVAAQLFFDGDIFGKSFSSFIWRGLIILLIVGVSGLLLLTSVSIYEDNKTLAYVSGAMILVTALFALLFFIIGKYEKGFLSTSTLTLVILSLLINQITDMQYRAKKSLTGLKIAAGVTGGVIALILELSVYSLMGKFWNSTAFVFFFVVLCLAFIGLKIAVGAIAKSANGKAEKSGTEAAADNTGAAEETVTISRAEYEELLKFKAEYENKK